MLDLIQRFFGKKSHTSKMVAKERLRLVLVHDRASVSPHLMEIIKEDLFKVMSQYVEIDRRRFDVDIDSNEESVALVANIPIVKVKRLSRS